MASLDERLDRIERALGELGDRVSLLEATAEAGVAAPARPPLEPGPAAPQPDEPQPAAPRPAVPALPRVDLEDLLGGRVLAWLGGAAVLVGVVLFVAYAVRIGWIDEPTRVVLAFLGSTALLLAGFWLYERRGQTDAAVAAVAAAIAALYASVVAATTLYDLVHPTVGLAAALLIGAVGTAAAVRWDSRLVAALAIVGALLSPVLVDAGTSSAALGFMTVALLASIGVLLWRRWDWLAAITFAVSAIQLGAWLNDEYHRHLGLALAVLLAFWVLYVVAAIGYELRVPTTALRASSALLLLANAMLLGGGGWAMLDDSGHGDAAVAWVLLVALVHVALGAATLRGRISRELAVLLLGVGIGYSAIGLGLALSGPALVLGWSAEAAILAAVAGRTRDRRAVVGSAVFLALAAGHTLLFEAPVEGLVDGVDDLGAAAGAIAAVGIAAALAARWNEAVPREWRTGLEALAAAAAVYLPSIAIVDLTASAQSDPGQTPQVLLSAFWAITGFGALVYGLVSNERRLRIGGLALLGIAVAKVFFYDLATLESIYRVLSFIAIGLLLLAGAFAYQRMRAQQG